MAITLGSVAFDETHTTVREKFEEVGGRDARRIEITGVIVGEHSVADVEAKLDAILDASSLETYEAALSVRAGRRMWVRRAKFRREVSRVTLTGAYELTLEAEDPFEESTTATSDEWPVTASGQTRPFTAGGNVFSIPTITLVATGTIINPSFSDGTRTLAFSGTVGDGETLVLDGGSGVATLEGSDVTPYTSGAFPRIAPEGTTLTYEDDAASSHTATVTVAFRDRWW